MKSTNKILRYTAPVVKALCIRTENGFAVSTAEWGDKELNPWGLSTQSNEYDE